MSTKSKAPSGIMCFGELVVDCFGSINDGFMPKFGGAPGNTAVGLARLGHSNVSFAGKVGADFFGDFLESTLVRFGIKTKYLFRDKEQNSTLAFVSLGAEGKREFSFIPGAHAAVTLQDVLAIDLKNVGLLQFGSLTMTNPKAAAASHALLRRARKDRVFLSFDPNVRLALWPTKQMIKDAIFRTMPIVDMVKVNEEELLFLTGTKNPIKGHKKLWRKNLQALIVTLGHGGAFWKTATGHGIVPTTAVHPIDTTGAGDAFNAGLLHQLFPYISKGRIDVHSMNLRERILFANTFASLSTLQKGAIESLPSLEQVLRVSKTVSVD